jgi:hypothetical protein
VREVRCSLLGAQASGTRNYYYGVVLAYGSGVALAQVKRRLRSSEAK